MNDYREEFKAKHKGIDNLGIERSILRAWKAEWSVTKPYGHDFTHHFLEYLALFSPHIDQHDFTVRQVKAFEECVFLKQRKILNIIGGKNSGKCLAPWVRVRMSDGSIKRNGDIVEGDFLMGDDLKPRKVLGTNAGISNMVRICPSRGEPWECNDDHILTLERCYYPSNKPGHKEYKVFDISVKEYLNLSKFAQARCRLIRKGIDFPEQEVEFDPRLYGIWIGDGSKGSPNITIADEEVEVSDYIKNLFKDSDYNVKRRQYTDQCPMLSICYKKWKKNPFLDFVKKSVIDGEKRLLPEYMNNSRRVRMELLAGILDADGHASRSAEKSTYYEISVRDDGLAGDVCDLASSLGFTVTRREKFVKLNGKRFRTNRVNIIGECQLIPCLRKKCQPHNHDFSGSPFKIKQLGEGEWFGFTLDGNGRYLLADGTVTHNTNFMATFALAMVSIWPEYTRAYVAAPYMSAAESTVWGEMLVHAEKIKEANKGLWKGVKLMKSKNRIVFRDLPKSGFVELRTLDKVGKLQGTKSLDATKGFLLLLCDEIALFPTRDLLDLLDNLTGNDNFVCVDGCNFKNAHGLEGELCKPERREYEELDIDRDHEWDSDYMSYTVRLDGHRSPNVLAGKTIYSYLLKQKQIDDAAVVHGENGPKYLEQIRSFPNSSMSDYFVTSREKIRAGGGWDDFVFDIGRPTRVAACDPGFGGDPCRIGVFEFSDARLEDSSGRFHTVPIFMPATQIKTLELVTGAVADKEWIERLHAQSGGRMFVAEGQLLTLEKQIVIQAGEFLNEWGVERSNFLFDGSLRAEIVQEFVSILGTSVTGLDYGARATDRETGLSHGKKASDLYGNFVTEMYFNFSMLIQSGQFRGADTVPAAVRQLCSRMWRSDKKDIKHLESKADYKKAHQGQSPDDADVIVMGLEAALRAGFMRVSRGRPSGMGGVGKIIDLINNSGRFRRKDVKMLNR